MDYTATLSDLLKFSLIIPPNQSTTLHLRRHREKRETSMELAPEVYQARKNRSSFTVLLFTLLFVGTFAIVINLWIWTNGASTHPIAAPRLQPLVEKKLVQTTKVMSSAEQLPTSAILAAPKVVSTIQPGHNENGARAKLPDAQVLAQVNHTLISERSLQISLAADHAVAQLLGARLGSDETTIVQRVINNTLVQQAADAAGVQLDQATVKERLQAFLNANHKSSADLEKALSEVKLLSSDFETYFAHLLFVDTFVRAQAQKLGISDEAYLVKLQQAAQISFGPAAAHPLVTQSETKSSAPVDTAVIGKVIPFNLPVLDNSDASDRTRTDLDGHPIILIFSTSWCTYCREQAAALVTAQAAYAQKGIQLIEINVKEQQATAQTYFTQNQLAHPLALDVTGAVANAYHVTGFPTTFFLDAQGHVFARQIGVLTAEQVKAQIQQVLTK